MKKKLNKWDVFELAFVCCCIIVIGLIFVYHLVNTYTITFPVAIIIFVTGYIVRFVIDKLVYITKNY